MKVWNEKEDKPVGVIRLQVSSGVFRFSAESSPYVPIHTRTHLIVRRPGDGGRWEDSPEGVGWRKKEQIFRVWDYKV